MRKLILDVDTGTDDAVAIMLAAGHPELDLLAVTTVRGNAPLPSTTDNTLRVLDHIGRPDIGVHPGLARPVVRPGFPGQRHFESDSPRDMHGTTLPLPEARSAPREPSAVEFLLHTLRTTTERITLVPVGPLSNLATVLAIDPSVRDAVEEVVIMGGAHAYGNVTPSAEFNVWADPEAAAKVFAAGFDRLTLVPLDATHQALVTREDCDELAALGTPSGTAAATLITKRIDAYTAGGGVAVRDTAPVHDAVCVAYLVRPEVITTRPVRVEVETSGELTVGRTVMDVRPNATGTPNAQVAFAADGRVLVELMKTVFAAP
ncbi:nucleoside hydrolase [Amycolatopsis dongchuanensis]|uniref:Nucleoside hydrolase n=1 Tax=Amycolatopsis dongchuanensis TaxID=1070866 RepID=A0ABP9R4N4_9PSEU